MRRARFLRSIGLLAAAAMLPFAVAAQSPWYVGASIGQSRIDASAGEIENGFLVDDAFTAAGTTLDDSDTGWKLLAGYRLGRHVAIEAGWVDLGEATFDTTIVAAPAGTAPSPPFPIRATATARGAFVSALALWPVTASFTVFAKAGAYRSEAEFTEVITTTGATRVSRTERRTEPNFGVGLQWAFSPRLAARLEVERFTNVGRGIGGRSGRDVDFASLGIQFQF